MRKRVAITGGARGIGLATTRALRERGAEVIVGDLEGGDVRLDVRDRASFAAFLDRAGPIDVLINNAGVMPMGPFLEEEDAISELTIDIDLKGVMYGMRLALPSMIDRGHGHVINVISLAGRLAVPGAAVYTAAKHAAYGLTEAVRPELRGTGVALTAVLPARVETELVAGTAKGRGVPTVPPAAVADAIVRVIRRPRAAITVPQYLGGVPALQSLAPRWAVGLIRRMAGDDRILTRLDRSARAEYEARISALRRVR